MEKVPYAHVPILVDEILALFEPCFGGVFIDGTLGGGGHTKALLDAMGSGRVIGIDRDKEAIAAAKERLSPYKERFTALKGNFFDMKELIASQGLTAVDGILLDLGVSSYQLDNPERGFSYKNDAPLDMRMDQTAALTAYRVVNEYPQEALAKIFQDYGEERFAWRIAEAVHRKRQEKPIETTGELAELIKAAIPAKNRYQEKQHPARRCFQGLRIEVNGELKGLEQALFDAVGLLKPGGRICVLSFHSLEDRIVKNVFRTAQSPCTCDPKAPMCTCGKKPYGRILTKKPVEASAEECKKNSRSECAKLRALEKTEQL